MQVQVTGKQLDVGEALRARISDELLSSIGKYFERGGDADVVVGKNGHGIQVDCSVTLASGQKLVSTGMGGDAHSAFDAALSKVEARIRRYKRRLKNHHHPSGKVAETAALMVLRSPEADDELDGWGDDHQGDSGHEPPAGVVIAETEAPLRTMTVSMAVMEMDLTESQAIVFRNAAHGGLSVVYRRRDGNIGWVDPERTKTAV
ncbi:MAG: ribosome hibernation-promoting factor, HPF/YfiA family [Caulobacteraceae bacterium]